MNPELQNLIDQRISTVLMASNNLIVPRHVHNGVDSPVIPIGNLLIQPNIGIPFTNGVYSYNEFITNSGGNPGLVFEPSDSFFDETTGENNSSIFFGEPGAGFGQYSIFTDGLEASTGFFVESDATDPGSSDSGNFEVTPKQIDGSVTDGTVISSFTLNTTLFNLEANGDFALQLPDTSLPTAVAGMIAFSSGVFYACETDGTWKIINLT